MRVSSSIFIACLLAAHSEVRRANRALLVTVGCVHSSARPSLKRRLARSRELRKFRGRANKIKCREAAPRCDDVPTTESERATQAERAAMSPERRKRIEGSQGETTTPP